MALEISGVGTQPSIEMNRLEYTRIAIITEQTKPYRKKLTAVYKVYGEDVNGMRIYEPGSRERVLIQDIELWISNLNGVRKTRATNALNKIEDGLGILADIRLGINFVGVI